ncbi:cyanophycinase [Parapusillimonas sp. SGNA-6]|nr:cyanophycinase [Parapusillimonas sp. SGNA-6]
MTARQGHLFIVGGREDREDDMEVLKHYVELCGGPDARVAVLTSASTMMDNVRCAYDAAFDQLGLRNRVWVPVGDRREASNPAYVTQLSESDGIYITGGDQKRLLATIGGTPVEKALRHALRERGACIGGTSAGASAMSEHMLAAGPSGLLPEKGAASLAAGLGFLRHVVIDQHFSERRRLGRLLSVVAQNPGLIGVGIDEDTALVISADHRLDVVGSGAVTIIDGRHIASSFLGAAMHERLEMWNVTLHLLPAGCAVRLSPAGEGAAAGDPAAGDLAAGDPAGDTPVPDSVRDLLWTLTSIDDEDR